jgi:hypothetical protein
MEKKKTTSSLVFDDKEELKNNKIYSIEKGGITEHNKDLEDLLKTSQVILNQAHSNKLTQKQREEMIQRMIKMSAQIKARVGYQVDELQV